MIAHRRFVTVQQSKQIVLSDLPFQPGQRVEVVMIAEDDQSSRRVNELRELFQIWSNGSMPRPALDSEDALEQATLRRFEQLDWQTVNSDAVCLK